MPQFDAGLPTRERQPYWVDVMGTPCDPAQSVTVSLPILYSFRRCPYAMRARLALCQAGVPVELREVDLKRKPAALLATSPAGTVPVLEIAPDTALVQSLDILRWALAQRDADHWLTRGNDTFNQWLVHTNDGDFKRALDHFKYANRHPQRSPADYREDAVRMLIAPLDAKLQQSAFVGGDGPCWADAAVFPFVRQFAAVDAVWWKGAHWTATRRWLQGWQSSALFARCMHKCALWHPEAAPVQFPPPPSA